MKIFKLLILFATGVLAFAACEDSHSPVLNPNAEPPAILSPSSGENYILAEENTEEELFTIEWAAPDFGFAAAVNYRVEMGSPEGNFENPVNIGSSTSTSLVLTVEEMNGTLLTAGLPSGEETTVPLRVRAMLGDSMDPLYSDPVELGFTPYAMDIGPEYPEQLFLIGSSVGDWDWGNTDLEMIPVATKPHLFWKIVWIEAGADDAGYKFAPERDWGNDFGYNGEAPSDGIVEFGGDNMPDPEETGYYMVIVNYETEQIAVVEPLVYLIGETVGSWDMENPDALFSVDNDNEVISITRELAADELRMYAWYEGDWFTDWWQSEFMIFGSEIEFRGTGDDQDRVNINAEGEYTIELNFRTNEGSIE